MDRINNLLKNEKYHLFYILFSACLMRYFFSYGHIFSDDAYFNYLAYTLYKLDFTGDYIGYPISPLRINLLAITAFAYFIFGINEFATMFFPMIFSLANIFLAYRITLLISENKTTAIFAAFLMAFLPTDIAFATINFADAPSAFFINFGLYFLIKAHKENKIIFSLYSGISFFLSVQFKVNIFYIGFLLGLLWIYLLIKNRSLNQLILISVSFVFLNLLTEGLVYLFFYGDFLYRFHQMDANYFFGRNDHFTLGGAKGYAAEAEYWTAVLKRVFIDNVKSVYLRRFYLFLPVIAFFQSINFIRKKEYAYLAFWFLGLSVMFVGFTASFSRYQPLVVHLSWYIFPLFIPSVIISSIFLMRLNITFRKTLLIVYLAGSIFMSFKYQEYFDIQGLSGFKSFVNQHPAEKIYTDHFTKYSIDFLDGFPQKIRTQRIMGQEFNFHRLEKNSLVVYNFYHIEELESQGFYFPDFSILKSGEFKPIFQSGGFQVFEKI